MMCISEIILNIFKLIKKGVVWLFKLLNISYKNFMKKIVDKIIIFFILFILLIPSILRLYTDATTGNGTASLPWDVSENGDGSVTAVLSSDGKLTISGEGAMKSKRPYPWQVSKIYQVVITSGVTNIGDDAFYACTNLTSINISDSVISIGEDVFVGCDSLKSINVSTSNTNYSSMYGVLINKNKTTILRYPAKKV